MNFTFKEEPISDNIFQCPQHIYEEMKGLSQADQDRELNCSRFFYAKEKGALGAHL